MALRLFIVCLAIVAIAPPTRAADNDPTVFVRIQSVSDLLAKAKYLAKLSDQEETVAQIIGIVEAMDGPKGIEGVDTKRPIGLTATLENAGPENPVLLMIPVADEKDFVNLLSRFVGEPKKDKDGIYPIEVPGVPMPIFLRFTQKYAFVTIQEKSNLDDKKLPNPAKLLDAPPESVASFHFRFDRLPADIRNLILGQLENQIADAKEKKMPGESAAARKARVQGLDYFLSGLKGLMTDGKELQFGFQINPKNDELSFATTVTAKPKTSLAKSIQSLDNVESQVFGSLNAPNVVAKLGLNIALPSEIRKHLDGLVDDLIEKAVDAVPDPNAAPLAEKLLKSLAPTLKTGMADVGVGLVGPNKDQHFTLLVAGKVAKGKDIEKAVKGIVGDLPQNIQDLFDFDVAKADKLTLHEVKIGSTVEPDAAKVFGQSSIWLGTSEDRLFFAFGPEGKELISRAAGVGPKTAPIITAEFHLGELLPLFQPEQAEELRKAAKKVFGNNAKGEDVVQISLTGGEQLTFKIAGKGKILSFGAEAQKAARGN